MGNFILANGSSYSNGNSFGTGKTTEREAPLIRRLLGAVEQRS